MDWGQAGWHWPIEADARSESDIHDHDRVGWYGASNVRIYFYLVDKDEDLPTSITQIPRARWILAHELILADTQKRNDLTEDDGAGGTRSYDVPSLKTPSLPIWVEINNSGNLARSHFIERYGASVLLMAALMTQPKFVSLMLVLTVQSTQ